MLIIFVETKMASIDSIDMSFLNLAKFRYIYERHGFSIELAEISRRDTSPCVMLLLYVIVARTVILQFPWLIQFH